ncbi:DC-STAMP domain-containing protein 2-like [Acanthaster planci]|uniref:DC-STAMP domain-containing protein 2-like n=1 Tax=Acanthaster planci TaxID=133434 RepID=A0A8B7XUE9_ACAPL|nr:DC-STAMP domain-containing protein 2-like [Acanthaster planci]
MIAARLATRQAGKQVAKKQMKKQMQKQVKKKVQQKVEDKMTEKAQEKMQDSMDKRRDKKAAKKKKKPRFMGLGDMEIDMHDDTDDVEEERKPRKGVRYSIFAICRGIGKFYRFLSRYMPCCRSGTFANQITKNVAGFLCGIMFLMLFYPIFVLALTQDPKQAALTIMIIGPFVCFGMAFSRRIRCVMLLMVPQLFSGKGRTILMAYGFLLVLSGPVENLSYNMDVAGHSQVCGSELAMNQSYKLFQVVTAPMASFSDEVSSLIHKLRVIGNRITEGFLAIKDAVDSLGNAVTEFFDWLSDMVDKCNERLGVPQKRCERAFEHAAYKCRKHASIFNFVCGIVDLISNVCHIAGILKILCIFPQIIIVLAEEASQVIDSAIDKLEDQFYVDFEFHHEIHMDYNFSQTARQIKESILGEMEERTEGFLTVVTWLNRLMSFAFILLILKAYKYYHAYRVKDKHDNWYVTKYFEGIDEKRKEAGKETLLPLKRKERRKYITPSSVYLARPEKRRIILGFVMWTTQLFYAAVLMAADCMAYWFLDWVRMQSELNVHINAPGAVTLDVQGDGILVDIYRALIQSLDPRYISDFAVDTTKCLPYPSQPDIGTYRVIGAIFIISLFLIMFEAYGLRLRRLIMSRHYPERERVRAVWLYNQILRRRGSFKKFLKRNKKTDNSQGTRDYGFASHLASRSKVWAKILRICGFKWKFCVNCSAPGKVKDTEGFVNCANAGCPGIYCLECVDEIQNVCQLCSRPVDYTVDIGAFDFERASSDEDVASRRKKQRGGDEESVSLDEESEEEEDLDYSYQYESIDRKHDEDNVWKTSGAKPQSGLLKGLRK